MFTQTLRSRARIGQSTRVLYVDLAKAYNRVHLASLWHLLREMGVPEPIVNLLDDWAAKRRSRMRVNGELTPEYTMLAGTPQGCPLSCLLFNLFIEPLIRHIKSIAAIRGVSISNTERIIKALFFADDISGLSSLDDDDLQLIMDAIMLWCRDWGMEVSTGRGKSETVSYHAILTPSLPSPPTVLASRPCDTGAGAVPGPTTVPAWGPWKVSAAAAAKAAADPEPDVPSVGPAALEICETNGYRYLGWRSQCDISDTLATANIVKTMDSLYYRYFTFNLTIRRCSPTLQLQLLHCNVFGPIIYLLSTLSVSSALQSKIDRRFRRYVRPIFGLSRGTPNSIVTAISRVNPFRALQSRERARLCLQLACPLFPDESIAHAVFNSLSAEGPGRRLSHANMPVRHFRELVKLQECGVNPPPASPPHYLIPIEAGLFGDRVALYRWQREARIASGVPNPRVVDRPRRGIVHVPSNTLRLPRALPLEHAADLYFNFSHTPSICPIKHGLAPLSYLGPSGTSILALSNHPCSLVSIVARLQAGNVALRRYPWRQRNPVRPRPGTGSGIDGADDEFSDADTESAASSLSGDSEQQDDSETASGHSSSSSDSTAPPARPRRVVEAPIVNARSSVAQSSRRNSAPGRLQHENIRAAALYCRLCKSGHEHPAHIFFSCKASRLLGLQRDLLTDACKMWGRLLAKIELAVLSEYPDTLDVLPEIAEAKSAVDTIYRGGSACEFEAKWLTYRLLWAIPWPASAVPVEAAAARALGAAFDATILSRHAARPLADSWLTWSVKWTKIFGETWADLMQDFYST